jgi:amino acid permease
MFVYRVCAGFYTELKDRSLPRFGVAVSSSFGLSAVLYSGIACFGFLTFGGNSSSYILNNYSPYDPLATVSRIAVGLSTLMAYPIVFMGVRDGVLDVFEVPVIEQTHRRLNFLTLILLSILTVIAVFVTDLGLINAVGGGLVSTMIVFVFPTLMFRSAVKKMLGEESATEVHEVALTTGLTVIGVILGVIGAWLAVTGTGTVE